MLRILLYPFAILYDLATSVRNELYNRGSKPSSSFDVPVISVGNLAVGGTGKTPMVEYLVRLLGGRYRVATLSRGYGRSSSGFIIASPGEDARRLGDEPLQLYRKYGDRISVAVGEDRALAIPMILQECENTEVIILDDAFQHRRVRPSFQVLLTDFHRPFFDDVLLPAGRLRESRKGASRADVVVVTKSPAVLAPEKMMELEDHIRQYTNVPVFFSTIIYGAPISFSGSAIPPSDDVIVVTGIANDTAFLNYLRDHYTVAGHQRFADHHSYTSADLKAIVADAVKHKACVVCTEKDFVKIEAFREMFGGISFFYIPILAEFIKNGKEFDEMVLNAVQPRERQ
jgi:tetraacyldisaccharide 4'-kinase